MAEQQQFVIDREMFNELMQIRELWLARNHDEEKAGDERDQRLYHPNKIIFTSVERKS